MPLRIRLIQKMRRAFINTGKWLLLVLFMGYYISTTCFYHTHYFSWGKVTHSHPYLPFGKGPANHTHTQDACYLIDYLANIVILFTAVAALIFAKKFIRSIDIPDFSCPFHSKLIGSPLRGPPALL